jgi:ADP-ribose pyrophosphatase YjhB (NUDIX family)
MPQSPSPAAPPVRLQTRRLACENTRFSIYFDHIVDEAAGVEVPNFLVVAPHCQRDDMITGVAVVASWDGKIVLLRPYRHPVGRHVYELPRGFVDAGEEPAAAALRELGEEAGLVADLADVRPLGECLPDAGVLRARVALFAVDNCRPGQALRDHEEIGLGEMMALPEGDVFAMLRAMVFEDVTATVALHRYAMLKGVAL